MIMALFKKNKFELLTDKADRKTVLRAMESIVERVRSEKVELVVGLEKSGRPTAILFRETWKKMFPKENPPKLYFINPEMELLANNFRENLQRGNGKLMQELGRIGNGKVLVLDDSAYFGLQTMITRNALKKLGAKNVMTAVLAKGRVASVDFYGKQKSWKFDDESSRFLELSKGKATGVRDNASVVSKANPNPVASAFRRDIKRLAAQAGKKKFRIFRR